MSDPENASLAASKLKTRSWVVLGGRWIHRASPFHRLSHVGALPSCHHHSWHLGFQAHRVEGEKHGLLVILAALLFVPFAFIAPLITTGLAASGHGSTQSAGNSAQSNPSAPIANTGPVKESPDSVTNAQSQQEQIGGVVNEKQTRETWAKLVMAINAGKEFTTSNMSLKLEGKDHLSQSDAIEVSLKVFWTIGQIKTAGADPELAEFMKKLSVQGQDVFTLMKNLDQFGQRIGNNFTQEQAAAYKHDYGLVIQGINAMDRELIQMHSALTQKYGIGFEEVAKTNQ